MFSWTAKKHGMRKSVYGVKPQIYNLSHHLSISANGFGYMESQTALPAGIAFWLIGRDPEIILQVK